LPQFKVILEDEKSLHTYCSASVIYIFMYILQTLRRLAQNREAARKSRLRKKVSHSTKTLTCTTLRNHTVQLCKVQGTTKTFIWYPPSHIYTNIYPLNM